VYLLTQLRTGHNWLSTYAKRFGFRGDDRCVCGAQETVSYVLVDCLLLRDIPMELRREVGDAFRSVSSLLGGSAEGKKGKPDTAQGENGQGRFRLCRGVTPVLESRATRAA
jgi:hypothetical protein